MRKSELERLTQAVKLIHTDEADGGDYHKGMNILADLIASGAAEHSPPEGCYWHDRADCARCSPAPQEQQPCGAGGE
jgi:hypothetical protein